MKHGIAVTVGAWLLVGSFVSTRAAEAQRRGDRCEFSREISVQVSASESDRLRVSVGSGSLDIEGRVGASGVVVTGIACASRESLLEELEVVLDRRGSRVELDALYPDDGWRNRDYARMDLRIEVALGMDVDVHDGSGSITLIGLGDVRVDDGSGSIYVQDILGSVDIDDGSGDVEIIDVQGDVFVDDGSGSVDIIGVAGSVTIDDGSGSIDIRDVGQDVLAYDIGSGSIRVTGVAGDFTVRDGREERISYSDVQGVVDIPERRRRR